jgi:DNA-binding LacI/PurR family transcriptional regulator
MEEAIAELGYRHNAVARSMARGRTCMLACFSQNLVDYTFACIIEGAETIA